MFCNRYFFSVTLVTLIGGALGCETAEASVFTYNDFSDVSNLKFVTSATTYQNRLRVNGTGNHNSGAVWTTEKHAVAHGFSTSFDFAIGEITQGSGSDVFRFVVQNYAQDAVFNKSSNDPDDGVYVTGNFLFVEIDTYHNSGGTDPNNWHIEASYQEAGSSTRSYLGLANLPGTKNSDIHTLDIVYDAVNTQLQVSYDSSLLLDVDYDLGNTLTLDNGSSSWIGFSAASGAYAETHDVYNWSWNSNDANPVPEPATIAVWSILGLCGVGYGVRRKMKKTA